MTRDKSGNAEHNTALIAVDWGTSSFRAYLMNGSGAIVDRFSSGSGIMAVKDGLFEDELFNNVGNWLKDKDKQIPILMSGMIGSRQGWVEADYIEPPASLENVAASLTEVSHGRPEKTFIVPGMSTSDGIMPDVMRGEETQIFGAVHQQNLDSGTFVLPGTHSKWIEVEAGAIVQFMSLMTGEVFAALCGHTILGKLMSERNEFHEEGFRRGLDAGHRSGSPGALLHRVFGARTLPLMQMIPQDAVQDYLSGLLIGAEFAEAAGQCHGTLKIIGASELADRYFMAADHVGLSAEQIDPDCTAAGLFAIAGRAGLLQEEHQDLT